MRPLKDGDGKIRYVNSITNLHVSLVSSSSVIFHSTTGFSAISCDT